MPSRTDSFRVALPHILPQVDRLFLYLDKYEDIPEEIASNPKIVSVLGGVDGKSLGSCGKLSALTLHPEPCLFLGLTMTLFIQQAMSTTWTLPCEDIIIEASSDYLAAYTKSLLTHTYKTDMYCISAMACNLTLWLMS